MDIERVMRLNNTKERQLISDFLARFNLTFEDEVEYTMALYRDDQIIGTGSLNKNILRNIAIDTSLQGEGLMAKVISNLMAEGARRNIFSFQLFTKVENVYLFESTGFKTVAIAKPHAALLEIGLKGVADFCQQIKEVVGNTQGKKRSALVMNCNPFTLGHRALIEYASKNSDEVCLFVVEEDKSIFPFVNRLQLVKEGTSDLKNVHVFSGGNYIISSATFPTYFVKGQQALEAQTRLDATVFAEKIAPLLEITERFVGEEPEDKTTQAYNDALNEILPLNNIALTIIPRIAVDNTIVSASKVRRALVEDNWADVQKWVPQTTLEYLKSENGAKVIEQLKATQK